MIFTLNLNKHVLKHSETPHPLISSFFQSPDAGPVAARAGFHPHRGCKANNADGQMTSGYTSLKYAAQIRT